MAMRLGDLDKLANELQAFAIRYAEQGLTEVAKCYNFACTVIDNAPTADVAPVVHARWVKLGEADYQCSSCGFRFTSGDDISEFKHCRCGAKMDGERRNDAAR